MSKQAISLSDQYAIVRENLPQDILLVMRVGDCYEFFHQDASRAKELLPHLTLTKRGEMPMLGFPYHSLDTEIAKLVKSGYRVAVCERNGSALRHEAPAAKLAEPAAVPIGAPVEPKAVPAVGGSASNEEFHSVPRLSASGLSRSEACPASLARELEMHQFIEAHGLPGLPSSVAAQMGTKFHSILASIPYVNNVKGLRSDRKSLDEARPSLFAAIRKGAEAVAMGKLTNPDFWYCVNAIKARNQIIDHVLAAGEGIAQPIKEVRFNFDQHRLFVQYPANGASEQAVEFSGLPDVQVTILDAKDRRHAIIADYKSGYLEQQDGEVNRQLTGLAALSEHDSQRTFQQTLSSVHVITLSRADLCPPPDENGQRAPLKLARYGEQEIQAAVAFTEEHTRKTAKVALGIQQHFADGGDGRLPETVQEELHEKATVGSHCDHCDGKTCCTKFRASVTEFARLRLDKETLTHIKEANARVESKTMIPEDLHTHYITLKGVIDRADIYDKSLKQAGELIRQILTPGEGHEAQEIRGLSLKPGARKFAVRVVPPSVAQDKPADGKKEAQAKARTLPPEVVFDSIKAIPGVSKEDFLKRCCEVNPGLVREYISGLLEIPESKVMERLESDLGESNPFEFKPNKPTILAVPQRELREMERAAAKVSDYLPSSEPAPAEAALSV